jgi:hypothetical protein
METAQSSSYNRVPVPPHVIERVRYPSARYSEIESRLVALYAEIEPTEETFHPLDKLKCTVQILWAKTGELIAFDVLTNTKRLAAGETKTSFVAKGGLVGRKGFFLTSLAGKRRYRGIASLMIAANVDEARRRGFDYILLHVSVPSRAGAGCRVRQRLAPQDQVSRQRGGRACRRKGRTYGYSSSNSRLQLSVMY